MNLKFLITRTILETPAISQRTLAKKFFVSLGKINSVLNEAIDDGYLKKSNKEGHYEITKKGIAEIEKHRVDGAVILACGKGLRIKHNDEETPVSFIKIKGERLIERQIEQLKKAGIDDIIVMVGFMKEKFDYLIDKYNVKLVYNDEYKYKSTLSTFYHSREMLRDKNMYICVSDVYIEDNIYHKYEVEPYYVGQLYDDCKNEWRLVTNSKNEIKEVEVGGSNDFCIVGPCFLTREYLDKLIPLVEEYYNKSFTDDYYWENVLVNNLKNLPTLYLYKLDKGIISEFDTVKDVEEFNKKTGDLKNEIIDYVSNVFKTEKVKIQNVACLREDVANDLYSFNIDLDTYVIRIPKENANEFINRKNEKEIIDKLSSNNKKSKKDSVVPTEEVVHFNVKNGYKISKYIKSSRVIDINNESELKMCMKAYKKLHTCGVKVSSSCGIIDMIYKYLDIIRKNNMTIPYEDFDEVIDKAKEIKDYINSNKRIQVICHGSPFPNNIMYENGKCILIDFEYGGMADPISDIAMFCTYLKFDLKKILTLFNIYKEIKIESTYAKSIVPTNDKLAQKLFISYMALGGLYNAVWSIVRGGSSGADYGTLGMDGYRTFKNCYKSFVEI